MPRSPNRLIRYEVLQAPREHLGVVIEPPRDVLRTLPTSARQSAYERVPILDTTLGALRRQLRARLELAGPVIVTGHQAAFVHAGVFAKTIAAHVLVQACGGEPVFLTVDCDVPKTGQLAVPQLTAAGVRRVGVDIPGCDPRRLYETQPAVPREQWLEFFGQVATLHPFSERSLLRVFADAWLATDEKAPAYCAALARARAATEEALGVGGVRELRMSALCTTPEFRAFAAHLLLHARHAAECYNAAQLDYRRRHRVRSPARPAPPLAISDAAVEVPLWICRSAEPRQRLSAAVYGDALELLADGVPVARMPQSFLGSVEAHGVPWPLEHDGWYLRPRALALSGFARLLLADLFIHGIGGAKYDGMMEDFARGFFGIQPRPACCVTATAYLPLPHSGIRDADVAAARRQSRDLRFNPQRHLHGLPPELVQQRASLVQRSVELREQQPRQHGPRRLVFSEIRRASEQMLQTDPWRPAEYDQRIETLLARQRLDRVALDREYFYALHPRQTLDELVQVVRRELAAP